MNHDLRDRVAGLSRWYAAISPASLAELPQWYTPDARFKDPFNDVRGVDAIRRIFEHMFESLHGPHFVVTRQIVDGQQAFLVWEFRFRFKRFDTVTEQVVHGGSHITLNEQGLVSAHRDYWDAAEELYEKLPVVGGLMRWLKRRANT
ncbi:MAG: nuclear transport factor 2 family protein [Hydrogenophaga sp.]